MKKKVFFIIFAVMFVMSTMAINLFSVTTAQAETLTETIMTDKDKFKDDTGVYDCWTTGGMHLYVGYMKNTQFGYTQSVLGFDVPSLPDNVTAVELIFRVDNAQGSPKLTLSGSYEDEWSETDETIPNKDVEIITNKGISAGWQVVDVTSFVLDQYNDDQYATFVMTPTGTDAYNVFSFHASEASSDVRPYLKVSYTNPSVEASASADVKEDNIDGMTIGLTIVDDSFTISSLSTDMFSLDTESAANGVTIASVTYVDDTHATLTLAQDGRDIDVNFDILVSVDGGILTSGGDLTSNGVYTEVVCDIMEGGTYDLDDLGADAHIVISTTEHVVLTQTSTEAKKNFTITYTVNGADLEINDIHIANGNYSDTYGIDFMGDLNQLTLSGTNRIYTNDKPTIIVNEDTALEIEGEGTLYADSKEAGCISSESDSNLGEITINGGTIIAQGGEVPGLLYTGGVGIGGNGGTITINGGTITATGGDGEAGIGNPCFATNGCTININGGTVTAAGNSGDAAGIGGSYQSAGNTINISGGYITAGYGGGTGIGSGGAGELGTINISGGIIYAKGDSNGAGIGTADHATGGTISISGGLIYADGYNGTYDDIGNGYSGTSCQVSITGSAVVFLRYNALADDSTVTLPFYNTETITNHMAYDYSVPEDWSGTAYAYISDNISVSGVSVSPESCRLNINNGKTIALTTTVTPKRAKDTSVSYSSSDTMVATVDASGVVTPVGLGTATITATTTDGGYTDTCEVTVYYGVTSVTLLPYSKTLVLGDADTDNDTVTVTATVFPDDAMDKTVTYKSSDTSVATVDSSGVVTDIKAGTATITVTTTDGGYTDTCFITVEQRATGVTASPDSRTLVLGDADTDNDTVTVTTTVSPDDATDKAVTYKSSDPSVATVDASGVVTAIKAGTATITVTTADGGYTDTCDITVEQRVTGVTVSPYSRTLVLGDTDTSNDTVTVTPVVKPNDAIDQTVSYSSSDPSVATVDENGVVTAVKKGTATITVTTTDGGYTDTCAITVMQGVTGVSVSPETSTLVFGDGDTTNDSVSLSATISPADADEQSVTWSSSDTSVATVDASGVVTAHKAGTATIRAVTVDGGYTAACTVTVGWKVTGVNLANAYEIMKHHGTRRLAVMVLPDNALYSDIAWVSDDESVATVDAQGRVTAVGLGSSTITVTVDGISDTCIIVVNKRPVSRVRLYDTSKTCTPGDTFTLTAAVIPYNATNRKVTWASSDLSVATVDRRGNVTAVGIGNATISAEADGIKAYCTVIVKADAVSPTPAPTPAPTPMAEAVLGHSLTPVPQSSASPTPAPAESAGPSISPSPALTAVSARVAERDDKIGNVTVQIDVGALPEGTKAIQLPDGSVIDIGDGETVEITISKDDFDDNGMIELLLLDDEAMPLASVELQTADEISNINGEQGGGGRRVFLWLLIGLGGIGGIGAAAYRILRKRGV